MTFNERLKKIKKELKRPYHFFALDPNDKVGRQKILVMESSNPDKGELKFVGLTRFDCIKEAELYLQHEKEAGNAIN